MMDIQAKKDSHIGALFPRVHVSETRVPGPRAPPRNKMGLFEQFTIPPHSFVPPLMQENSSKVTSQGGGQEINSGLFKPKQVKLGDLNSKESDVSCSKVKCEALRRSVAEVCVHSETLKSSAVCDSGEINCSLLPVRHASSPNSLMQNLWSRSTEESDVAHDANLSSTDIKIQHSTVESRAMSLSTKRMAMPQCGWTGIGARDTNKVHALFGANAESHSYNSAGATYDKGANSELLVGSAGSNVRSAGISRPSEAHVLKGFRGEGLHDCTGASDRGSLVQQLVCSDRSSEVAGDTRQEKHITPLQKCDGAGWNSDSLPRIIPKHVIGVIGQREFWEARKTMLQQQKTLSMQIFELHRLIEVQHLIAAKPGLLLEGKDKCYVVKSSMQPEIAKVSNKLVSKESLNKEARHCTKPKQSLVKGPKKHVNLSSGVGNTTVNGNCQNPSLLLLPLKPIHVSLDQSRVSTWGIAPTWVKPGSHNYGLCRGPMALGTPSLGHLYNEQQVLQDGSYMFTNGSRPCNFPPKYIPEVYNPPLAFPNFVNGSLIYQMGCAPGAQTSESLPTLNQATSATLNPSLSAQHNKPNINSQQGACGAERKRSVCNKLASQSKKFAGVIDALERGQSMSQSTSAAGSRELRSERSGMGFQTFCKMVSTGGNESETLAQPAKVVDMVAATESPIGHKGDSLCSLSLENVSIVEKGEKNGGGISKVIRAVPHPASEAVKAAAKILKSIQQSESSRGFCLQ